LICKAKLTLHAWTGSENGVKTGQIWQVSAPALLLLAATGLLDGKSATTHWGMARQFKKTYPDVKLRTDLMVTDEGNLFCGGGITADLKLASLRFFAGTTCGSAWAGAHDPKRLHPSSPIVFEASITPDFTADCGRRSLQVARDGSQGHLRPQASRYFFSVDQGQRKP
jgi:hypothetical protein